MLVLLNLFATLTSFRFSVCNFIWMRIERHDWVANAITSSCESCKGVSDLWFWLICYLLAKIRKYKTVKGERDLWPGMHNWHCFGVTIFEKSKRIFFLTCIGCVLSERKTCIPCIYLFIYFFLKKPSCSHKHRITEQTMVDILIILLLKKLDAR